MDFGEKVADSATGIPSPPPLLYIPKAPYISLSQSSINACVICKTSKVHEGGTISLASLAHGGFSVNTELCETALLFVIKCLMSAISENSL